MEHNASYYERQFNDRQEPSSRPEGFPCHDPFHADTCFGTPHRLRQPDDVWCAWCDQPSVFAMKMPLGIEALCGFHGLELARDASAHEQRRGMFGPQRTIHIRPVGGIEQYQAEGR